MDWGTARLFTPVLSPFEAIVCFGSLPNVLPVGRFPHWLDSCKLRTRALVLWYPLMLRNNRGVAQLEARHVWDVEVPGSSPGTPTSRLVLLGIVPFWSAIC